MLVGLFLGAMLLAAGTLVWSGLHDQPGYADLAVVLGNEVLPDGRPSPRLAARLDRAAELYGAHGCGAVLVSGGPEGNGYDEATVMARYLADHGVPADRLWQDHRGVDTYATARNTRSLLRQQGWRSVCVVTQYFHVPRACLAMRRFGVRPVYAVHARYFEWRDFFSVGREVACWVKYDWRPYNLDGSGVKP